METLITFFEKIIYSLQGLWNLMFKNIDTLVFVNKYFPDAMKPLILNIIPDFAIEVNFISLISVGFISFLLVWSLIKIFTNIL